MRLRVRSIIVWSALALLAACAPTRPPVQPNPPTPAFTERTLAHIVQPGGTPASDCAVRIAFDTGESYTGSTDATGYVAWLIKTPNPDPGGALNEKAAIECPGYLAFSDSFVIAATGNQDITFGGDQAGGNQPMLRPGPVPLAPPPPTFPALTTDGPIFREGGQAWRWRGVSAFKLAKLFETGGGAAIDGFLADVAGYNVLRVWDYVPAKDWHETAWDSTPAPVWVQLLDYVGRKGFRVELTLLTDDDPARIEPARQLVTSLVAARPPNLLLEAGNEPTTHKAIDTAALRATLEQSGFPYTSGDYEDSDRFYGSYYVGHTGRDSEWPRRAHDMLEAFTGAGPDKPHAAFRVPAVCDEPGKWQDVGADPADWRAYFGACSLLGAGATFHSESGKFAARLTDLERSLAAIALSTMNAFPADAPTGPYGRPSDDSLRTYTVGGYAVRVRPTSPRPPFDGTAIDPDSILWKLTSRTFSFPLLKGLPQ